MTKLVWMVAALLCATAVEGPALGKPAPAPVSVETATLRQYVDDITTPEGISASSARTAVHRRRHGKTQLTQ